MYQASLGRTLSDDDMVLGYCFNVHSLFLQLRSILRISLKKSMSKMPLKP